MGKNSGLLLPLVVAGMLSGCAPAPLGPSVMVLPGPGKTLEQFQADETFCQQWAGQRLGGPAGQWRYDIAYQQCMYAKGHRLPGVPELYAPAPPPPPAPPATAPLPPPHAP
jgi:hypothetical protein